MVVDGNNVVDSGCKVAICTVDVCKVDENVVDAVVRVLGDDDEAVCHGIDVEAEVVTPRVGSDDRVVGEETGGEDNGEGGNEGVM